MLTGILIILPLICTLLILFIRNARVIKIIALDGALAEFALSFYALYIYLTQCHCQLLMNLDWLNKPGISLRFGMDDFSLVMVLVTTFLAPLIIIWSWHHGYSHPKAFYGMILLMEMAFIAAFTSFNDLVFYIVRIWIFQGIFL